MFHIKEITYNVLINVLIRGAGKLIWMFLYRVGFSSIYSLGAKIS